jgi:hypothetical protein
MGENKIIKYNETAARGRWLTAQTVELSSQASQNRSNHGIVIAGQQQRRTITKEKFWGSLIGKK